MNRRPHRRLLKQMRITIIYAHIPWTEVMPLRRFALSGFALLALLLGASAASATTLVVYSERREPLIQPIFEQYTRETGIEVRWLTDAAPVLIERIAAEGKSTPADVFLSVDAGNLWQAAERGLLAPITSELLDAAVPAHLRDPGGRWYGLSQRARTIVRSTERVDPAELSGYAALADAQWKGRLCLRSSKKIYNQSLTAMMIAREGEARTETILRGWVANLAAPPFADDTLLAQAIAAGRCDVGIINTYYLGRLLKDTPDFPVTVFWPDQKNAGVHVNISGAGVVAASGQPQAAQALIEWLASKTVQAEFAAINLEFPVRSDVALDPVVQAWGAFRADPINVAEAGRLQADAVRLMDRVGWK
jgi:iron(III) transport system substrate-binding protein